MMPALIDRLSVPQLTEAEESALNANLGQLRDRATRNALRTGYYDAEQVIKHFGISIPPQFQSVSSVIGWPSKAVNVLEHRIDLQGFVTPSGEQDEYGLEDIAADNRLYMEAPQAHISALKYGCGFVAVMAGGDDEPPVVIRNLSATNTTGIWDANRRRLSSALTIIEAEAGSPTLFILFLADQVITGRRDAYGWALERRPHALGRCPVAVLPFQPSVERPMGRSRITRGVMSITDRVVRTLLRMEISAEFYSAPRSVLLGADDSIFRDDAGNPLPQWGAYLSKMLTIPLNEIDERPELKTLPQLTMQPHTEMVRSDAALFSGETDIPVHLLGVVHDNPASDAAMHTTYLELNKTAERAQMPFGSGWVDVMQMAVMVRDGLSELPEGLRRLQANFRDPSTPTISATSDAAMKLIGAGVLPADSDVVLEMLSLDAVTINRVKAERRRLNGRAALDGLLETDAPAAVTPAGLDADDLNKRGNFVAMMYRSGADFDSAMAAAGLPGIEHTGLLPVTLQKAEQVEAEADAAEAAVSGPQDGAEDETNPEGA